MDTRMLGRRRMIGLAAAGLASLTGLAGVAAKRGGSGGKAPSAPGKTKVGICHKLEDGTFKYMRVPATAVKGHAKHGDVVNDVTGPDVCDALNADTPSPTPLPPNGGGNGGNGSGNGGGNGGKVAICHRDDDTGLFEYKEVPANALKGHEKHGDVVSGVTGPETCAALNPTPEPPPEPTPEPTPETVG